ncbi:DNA utilization family protein [Pseudomonas sessilinigenes]|uniref:DUF2531 family protein n=1 Tax=Pseudomonas sessilinigenes TaxID=658629 RepID=A0ABX8MLA1_9PSED|nr:DNA utilization family protein [Pseudomonas sessilinigenes]AZC26585.1 General secretion pathway protein N [Pseudomonas sessilinigenes]QXH39417.1 DUF2531 family protein [Pseudomonas sessilinigenes]
MTRLSPSLRWLSAAVLGLLGLLLTLLNGVGTKVQWLPALDPSAAPVKAAVTAGPMPVALSAYEYTWKKPLFNAHRQPDPPPSPATDKAPSSLNGLSLTGVIASGALRKAFFKTSDGQQLAALEQQQLPNGWRVERIEPTHVTLTQGANTQTLKLLLLKVPQNTPSLPSLPDTSKDSDL